MVQTLHALSTALILIGLQKHIGETVPEERTGAAQGIAYFANGISMASVTLLSGPLYDWFGVNGFYVMAVFFIGGTIAALIFQPTFFFDILFFFMAGYSLSAWMTLTPEERLEFKKIVAAARAPTPTPAPSAAA